MLWYTLPLCCSQSQVTSSSSSSFALEQVLQGFRRFSLGFRGQAYR